MKSILFILLLCGSLYGQNSSFQKLYGGSGAENGWDVVQTKDLGFAAIGTSLAEAPGQGPSSIFLVRTDRNGDSTWSKLFGGEFVDEGYAICNAHDDGFYLAGKIGVPDTISANLSNIFLVKTDRNGNPEWTYENGTPQTDVAYAVAPGPDQSVVFTGSKNGSLSSFFHFAYLTKLDGEGNLQWSRNFSPLTTCYSVKHLKGGGYLLGGAIGTFLNYHLIMIRTDSQGNLLWDNASNWGSLNGQLRDVIQLRDGNFAATGYIGQGIPQSVFLAKTDPTGAILWSKKYRLGANAVGYRLTETVEGELIVTGSLAESLTVNSSHPFLLRTSSSGDSILARTYPISGATYAIKRCQDNGFIMCGTKGLEQKLLLIKTNREGDVLPDQADNVSIQTFPNPNSGEFDLQIVSAEAATVQVTVFDPRGRLVQEFPPFHSAAGSYLQPIDISEFASGVYFLRVVAGEQSFVKEILKL